MSEDSKVADLLQKIKVADARFSVVYVSLFLGGVLFGVPGAVWLTAGMNFGWSAVTIASVREISFLVAVIGAILFAIGITLTIHYNSQVKGYYKELYTKFPYAIPICGYCKKTLPKENPAFCVFCGKKQKLLSRRVGGEYSPYLTDNS